MLKEYNSYFYINLPTPLSLLHICELCLKAIGNIILHISTIPLKSNWPFLNPSNNLDNLERLHSHKSFKFQWRA